MDTSVPNFLYADDAPEKKAITIDFFEHYIKPGIFETFISNVVIAEIEKTTNIEKRNKLLRTIDDYFLERVPVEQSEEISLLTVNYIRHGIIPETKEADALHVAIAVVNDMDFLVSWNYKHLANIHRERRIHGVNALLGFSDRMRIVTPLELMDIDYE
ncbi:MAG: hypothetical protein HYZ34_13540 [Ignavibacteriae bacterium]|nr:hypothetical protein [Ignavibacteriota bacterium]